MAKIGILTCTSVTQDIPCGSFGCLQSFNMRVGQFERYADDDELQLVAIISCAGCPTLRAPEKILSRVRAIALAGATAMHISYCLMQACPYRKKYISLIKEHFPDLEVVEGTHPPPEDEAGQKFLELVENQLKSQKTTMAELACEAGILG